MNLTERVRLPEYKGPHWSSVTVYWLTPNGQELYRQGVQTIEMEKGRDYFFVAELSREDIYKIERERFKREEARIEEIRARSSVYGKRGRIKQLRRKFEAEALT